MRGEPKVAVDEYNKHGLNYKIAPFSISLERMCVFSPPMNKTVTIKLRIAKVYIYFVNAHVQSIRFA